MALLIRYGKVLKSTKIKFAVIPAKAGIQLKKRPLDPRLRGDDTISYAIHMIYAKLAMPN